MFKALQYFKTKNGILKQNNAIKIQVTRFNKQYIALIISHHTTYTLFIKTKNYMLLGGGSFKEVFIDSSIDTQGFNLAGTIFKNAYTSFVYNTFIKYIM